MSVHRKLWSLPFLLLMLWASLASAQMPQARYPMPSLEDERQLYRNWGWTWDPKVEPQFHTHPYPTHPGRAFVVTGLDVHGASEGDGLWSAAQQWLRTGQAGYKKQAEAWAKYFVEQYAPCKPNTAASHCYDIAYYGDHSYGWGLVLWYELTGDIKYLQAAETIATRLETMYKTATAFLRGPGKVVMGHTSTMRAGGRQFWLLTELVRVTPGMPNHARWVTLRNYLLDLWLKSPDWKCLGQLGQPEMCIYFSSNAVNDAIPSLKGRESYTKEGLRIASSMMTGVFVDGAAMAYLQIRHEPGKAQQAEELRQRLVKIARFVEHYGLNAKCDYATSFFGVSLLTGKRWDWSVGYEPSTSDPAKVYIQGSYTTTLVGALAWGYKLTGEQHFLDAAHHAFNRGMKADGNACTRRLAADNVVHHFIDTQHETGGGAPLPYYYHHKGELQFVWPLLENGGRPTVLVDTPAIVLDGTSTVQIEVR